MTSTGRLSALAGNSPARNLFVPHLPDPGLLMLAAGVLTLIIGASHLLPIAGPALGPAAASDTNSFIGVSRIHRVPMSVGAADDTLRQRRHAIEVSEWYSRRLTIHRYAAYASLPIFAFQYAAGAQLYKKGSAAPAWARNGHRVGATALAAIFTVNTVTGAWNWWDSRSAKNGRLLRTIHGLTFLGADAAFTYAGVKLADEAENSADKRAQHRTVALSAIAVSVVSGIGMKLLNR